MGCKCKKTAKSVEKYTNEQTLDTLTGVRKMLFKLRQIFTVVLVGIVFIFATPFMILLLIKTIIKGKDFKINLTKIIKIFHVRN